MSITNTTDNELKRFGRKTELEKQLRELGGEKITEENGFEYWELEDANLYLEKVLMERNWVFHGTRGKYKELVPQKSQDEIKESGNRVAVYFTNDPVLSEFCALAGGGKSVGQRKNSIRMSYDTDTKKVEYSDVKLAVEFPENVASEGFVYLSPREGMEYINGEYLSYEPREPDVVIKIKRSDLKYNIEKIQNEK